MAGSTRLELATSGVTGRRSNQLNYDPAILFNVNFKPASPLRQNRRKCSHGNQKTSPVVSASALRRGVVGETGLEPVTPGL